MAGLCDYGNEPPGSLKATCVTEPVFNTGRPSLPPDEFGGARITRSVGLTTSRLHVIGSRETSEDLDSTVGSSACSTLVSDLHKCRNGTDLKFDLNPYDDDDKHDDNDTMARNTLTMADRIKIITLMEQNMRQVDVANILHVNQSIVSRLWRKFQETQSIADRPREGRPRKTTPGQDRLHDIGLYARRPLKTPALRPHHRSARARWARAHENWTRGQWTRTLFSDEVRMGLHPDNNSIRVWRRTGERNHPSMTVERHQQFGGSILFWAGVMFGRRTPLVSIEGNMTAAVYENNILQPIVSGFAETVGEGFTLQDDNARPHRAHSVQRYLVEHGIRRMDWPACSPDMNCIEHAWSFLRRAISNRPHHPLTIQELRNAALEEWDNLPQESLDALVLSMPRRIQECLRVRGGPTRY
ncbi:hypothetical protein ANN_06505 [Periplaneta americana]|uniref:Tc1-like transposase DDE domain-containing protein n=1 Tax=Periplaneta americana TaxID=6978 RepID=A0ABQ8TFH8_PERAM|nr:hypothetical protein ANN_06505 [Periplaneta americana]